MKNTGITRKLDSLNRFTVPQEICNNLGIKHKQEMEVSVDNDSIILKKVARGCYFCGSAENLKPFEDYQICEKCLNKIKNII